MIIKFMALFIKSREYQWIREFEYFMITMHLNESKVANIYDDFQLLCNLLEFKKVVHLSFKSEFKFPVLR